MNKLQMLYEKLDSFKDIDIKNNDGERITYSEYFIEQIKNILKDVNVYPDGVFPSYNGGVELNYDSIYQQLIIYVDVKTNIIRTEIVRNDGENEYCEYHLANHAYYINEQLDEILK